MLLPEEWRAFIESLNSNGVEYVIVGAVALAYHGFPRYTADLDLVIRNSPENTKGLESALASFGFGGLGLKAADSADSYRVIQLGVPPNRVDLLTSITVYPSTGRIACKLHRPPGADSEEEADRPGTRQSGPRGPGRE